MKLEKIDFHLIKGMYDKSSANMILGRARQGFLLSPFLLNMVLDTLARVIRQEKEIKWEKKSNHPLGGRCGIIKRDPKNSIRKFLETISTFSKVAWYKTNFKNSLAFLYTTKNHTLIMETPQFTIASKTI